ncbi:MAG: hypothetical protein LUC96_00400, partial [Alistipes sp.]|nr:hypothetical protein [Alistipes sp.]
MKKRLLSALLFTAALSLPAAAQTFTAHPIPEAPRTQPVSRTTAAQAASATVPQTPPATVSETPVPRTGPETTSETAPEPASAAPSPQAPRPDTPKPPEISEADNAPDDTDVNIAGNADADASLREVSKKVSRFEKILAALPKFSGYAQVGYTYQ